MAAISKYVAIGQTFRSGRDPIGTTHKDQVNADLLAFIKG